MELRHRHLTPLVTDTLGFSPVVVLEGARRVGKSTLTTMLSDAEHTVQTTMDDPLARQLAHDDPIGFLTQAGQGRLIIDEVQQAPQLILPLKYLVDQDPRSGRFLLTGSANLLRVPGSEDSLAGRALTLRLEPFSQGELASHHDDWVTAIINFKDLPDRGNRTELVSLVGQVPASGVAVGDPVGWGQLASAGMVLSGSGWLVVVMRLLARISRPR